MSADRFYGKLAGMVLKQAKGGLSLQADPDFVDAVANLRGPVTETARDLAGTASDLMERAGKLRAEQLKDNAAWLDSAGKTTSQVIRDSAEAGSNIIAQLIAAKEADRQGLSNLLDHLSGRAEAAAETLSTQQRRTADRYVDAAETLGRQGLINQNTAKTFIRQGRDQLVKDLKSAYQKAPEVADDLVQSAHGMGKGIRQGLLQVSQEELNDLAAKQLYAKLHAPAQLGVGMYEYLRKHFPLADKMVLQPAVNMWARQMAVPGAVQQIPSGAKLRTRQFARSGAGQKVSDALAQVLALPGRAAQMSNMAAMKQRRPEANPRSRAGLAANAALDQAGFPRFRGKKQ